MGGYLAFVGAGGLPGDGDRSQIASPGAAHTWRRNVAAHGGAPRRVRYPHHVVDPRALAKAGEAEDADVGRFSAMTPEERLELFLELCDLTDSIVRDRPNVEALLSPTPRSPESEALWQRLMDEARRDRR